MRPQRLKTKVLSSTVRVIAAIRLIFLSVPVMSSAAGMKA
jgi:hypothetical protein